MKYALDLLTNFYSNQNDAIPISSGSPQLIKYILYKNNLI